MRSGVQSKRARARRIATIRRAVLAGIAAIVLGGCSGGLPAAVAPAAPSAAAAGSAHAAAGASLQYGTYAWDVNDVTAHWRAGTLWTLLRSKHVNDVLAGFDSEEIAHYSTPGGTATFNTLIGQAAQHGVKVELLLGDPSWILPSGVTNLENILFGLRAVHFAGLNLDLEPNQVTGQPMHTALADLVSSMRAYVKASPWPVTLDVNWIYVGDIKGLDDGYCLMCGLHTTALRHIDLMTYISDPATVVAKDLPLLQKYPWMTFTIAQSVEPPSVLPRGDSYWADGFARFYADMQTLDTALKPVKNYDGIVIEWLKYLETIKH
jgi:hypothetical protein